MPDAPVIRARSLNEVRAAGDLTWFRPALDRLRALGRSSITPGKADPRLDAFFAADARLYIARAPGRLDVMGGIADYSGARVLELPLECATTVMLQWQEEPRCDVATLDLDGAPRRFSIELAPLLEPTGSLVEATALRAWFEARDADRWASYVVGVVQEILRRAADARRDMPSRHGVPRGREAPGHDIPAGLRLLIDSTVPAGRGVASSAALEVAVAAAVAASCGLALPATELAAACQAVENHVVGAPCGIMDQMTSACGRRNRLLQLLCQPGTIEGHVQVPAGLRFYGIDSGISHAVSGADYGTVRTAAFMGYRMAAAAAAGEGSGWGGYLANLTPAELAGTGAQLPAAMSGAEFLQRYGDITDTATRVRPEVDYPVRAATQHPVHEHQRVTRFAELLQSLTERPGAPDQAQQLNAAAELGRLMYESHESYSACGLGSEGTDRLVELVHSVGPEGGLFGAKITGGGSGGTVAVMGVSDAEPAIRDVAEQYCAETGRTVHVFSRSGPGAAETGVLVLEAGESGAAKV